MHNVANNAPNLTDPSGLLEVCCRPVRLLHAYCHCFLVLSDAAHTTLGAYNPNYMMDLQKHENYPDDRPMKPGTFCKQVPASKCDEQRVHDAYKNLPDNLQYGAGGWTSNTVPATALRGAGLQFDFPPCAKGWNTKGSPMPFFDPWWIPLPPIP